MHDLNKLTKNSNCSNTGCSYPSLIGYNTPVMLWLAYIAHNKISPIAVINLYPWPSTVATYHPLISYRYVADCLTVKSSICICGNQLTTGMNYDIGRACRQFGYHLHHLACMIYSPYTFTVIILDTTGPPLLLTLHLYTYCPTSRVALVVYDTVLFLTGIQLLPMLCSQEYLRGFRPLALHW